MSNRYPAGFTDLLEAADGPVLDNGGGGRKHPRIVGLEYVPHPNNSVQADGLNLPFRDESFALVLSQAVLEHVTDPQRYVDEVFRVLRPGGTMWIEAAFLQPVHQAPWHFFNITPFGLAHLCQRFDVVAVEQFGSIVEQWEWIGREAGADEALTASERGAMHRMLAKVEAAMTPERRWNTASGVRLIGRKP